MNFLNKYLKFLGVTGKTYQKILKSKNIVFDTDGDRVFFKNKQGKIIRPDFVACLLAVDFLKSYEAKPHRIIIDLRSSKILFETIKKFGGKAIFSKVGHVFFKRAMAKNKAVFGAEFSGHYYFKEFFNCDNGLLAAIKVLDIVKKFGKKLDDLIKPFEKYFQSGEISIKIKNQKSKIKIMDKIEIFCKNNKAKINKLDGLSCEFDGWWFNLRTSNTESVVRLNIEAKTRRLLKEKQKLLKKLLS